MTQYTSAMNVVSTLMSQIHCITPKFSSVPAANTRQHGYHLPRQRLGNSHTEHQTRDFTCIRAFNPNFSFQYLLKQSQSCSFNSCRIHEGALPTVPSVFLIMGKSFTHTNILFWGIKSKNLSIAWIPVTY
jgi:hypothetical protein